MSRFFQSPIFGRPQPLQPLPAQPQPPQQQPAVEIKERKVNGQLPTYNEIKGLVKIPSDIKKAVKKDYAKGAAKKLTEDAKKLGNKLLGDIMDGKINRDNIQERLKELMKQGLDPDVLIGILNGVTEYISSSTLLIPYGGIISGASKIINVARNLYATDALKKTWDIIKKTLPQKITEQKINPQPIGAIDTTTNQATLTAMVDEFKQFITGNYELSNNGEDFEKFIAQIRRYINFPIFANSLTDSKLKELQKIIGNEQNYMDKNGRITAGKLKTAINTFAKEIGITIKYEGSVKKRSEKKERERKTKQQVNDAGDVSPDYKINIPLTQLSIPNREVLVRWRSDNYRLPNTVEGFNEIMALLRKQKNLINHLGGTLRNIIIHRFEQLDGSYKPGKEPTNAQRSALK